MKQPSKNCANLVPGLITLPNGKFGLVPELRAAERLGYSIVPTNRDKKTLFDWKELEARQPTREEFLEWLNCYLTWEIQGWARITGAHSRIFVLDDDTKEGTWFREWGINPHVLTPSGGCHWIGRHPGWRIKTVNSKTGKTNGHWVTYPNLDVKGDGGYSLIYGYGYKWLRPQEEVDELDLLPEEVRRFFGLWEAPVESERRVIVPVPRLSIGENADLLLILLRYALEVEMPRAGRDHGGFWLVRELRNNGLSREDAIEFGPLYVDQCPDTNTKGKVESYTIADFIKTVDSVYSRPPARPWVPDYSALITCEDLDSEDGDDESGDDAAEDGEVGEPSKTKNLDDRLARRWATSVVDRLLFAEGGQWWSYDNEARCWSGIEAAAVEIAVQRFLRQRSARLTVKRIREIVTLARDWLGPVSMAHFNARPTLIPLANGVYDVETNALIPHDSSYLQTHCLSYGYDPQAACPRVEAFLQQVLVREDGSPCEEWINFAWEWLGYCLTADASAHTAMVNVGEGGNGKGTFARLLRALVGANQCVAVSVEGLAHEYNRAHLTGKLVGFINEPSRRAMDKGGEWLKAISAGDDVPARHPCGRVFTFCPTTRFVISCNDLPATKDLSHGYFRRLVIVEWRFTPSEPDTHLDDKLAAELPGVFNKAVEGLARFRARGGRFESFAESEKLKREYRRAQDTVTMFVEDTCCREEGARTLTDVLYRAYQQWCKDNGHGSQTLNSNAFGQQLTKLGWPASVAEWDGKRHLRYRPCITVQG